MWQEPLTQLFKSLDQRTVVLTPNRRLTATLLKQHQAYQLERGLTSWLTPAIMPESTWIKKCFDEYSLTSDKPPPLLLSDAQENYLWQYIINSSPEYDYLLQVSETATLIKSAWKLLKQWQLDVTHPLFDEADDYRAMRFFSEKFMRICKEKNWIDQASLMRHAEQNINSGQWHVPYNLFLFGFNELSPTMQVLLEAVKQRGTRIEIIDITIANQTTQRLAFEQPEIEYTQMARWANALYQTEPRIRIGCVIPTLNESRQKISRIFAEVFAKPNHDQCASNEMPYNISGGKMLYQYPIIQIIFQILTFTKLTLPLQTFSAFLRSPFLGSSENEKMKRAMFDYQLRKSNIDTIQLTKLFDSKSALPITKYCPKLADSLSRFLDKSTNMIEAHYPSEWSRIFHDLVSILGWPGERSVSSIEYQTIEHWKKLLEKFDSLDDVTGAISYSHAVNTLTDIANTESFQPQTPDASIQVLGTLEAAGLSFDYLWVAGLDDLNWPPQPKPNPFIPKQLQRELQMPHSTSDRELEYCETLTTQFKQSAPHVIFSYSKNRDEIELNVSPLIRSTPEAAHDILVLSPFINPNQVIYQAKMLEILEDTKAPSYQTDDKISGGVKVIRLQSQCPFRAFAECRLIAREMEDPKMGMRAVDRGNLLHYALDIIWRTINNQEKLMAISKDELETLISEGINAAIDEYKLDQFYQPHYLSLEKERLRKMLCQWIEIEKQRPPFIVLETESEKQIALDRLTLSVRIDRVDQLQDGKKLIIDYKTGKNASINDIFSQRPDEPQLPLYTMIDPETTRAVTFAKLVPGEFCFNGVSSSDIGISGIKEISDVKKADDSSWDNQLAIWKENMLQLSQSFCEGHASVDPKDPPTTCQYCTLKSLCRISEERHEHCH